MKQITIFTAVFVFFLGISGFGQPLDVTRWNHIAWNTTIAEVLAKCGSAAHRLDQRILCPEVFADYGLASYPMAGFPGNISLFQNRETLGLCEVRWDALEPSFLVFEAVEKDLSQKYGAPVRSEIPSHSGNTVAIEARWAFASTLITLSFTRVWPVNSGKVALVFSSAQRPARPLTKEIPPEGNPDVDQIQFASLSGKEAGEFVLQFRDKDLATFATYFYLFLAKGPSETETGAFFDTLKFLTLPEYTRLGAFLHSSTVAMEWPGSLGMDVGWQGRGGTSIRVVYLNEEEIAQWADGMAMARQVGDGVGHHLPQELADRLFFQKAVDRFREIPVRNPASAVHILEPTPAAAPDTTEKIEMVPSQD
jgi:hypothetical protein